MVFSATFSSISVISWRQLTLFMSFLGFTSTKLGSEVSCPRKNPEDPVWLEPRTPGLWVKHFTTEPCGTLFGKVNLQTTRFFDMYQLKKHLLTANWIRLKNWKLVFEGIEDIVRKEKKYWVPAFFYLCTMFSENICLSFFQSWNVVKEVWLPKFNFNSVLPNVNIFEWKCYGNRLKLLLQGFNLLPTKFSKDLFLKELELIDWRVYSFRLFRTERVWWGQF